MSETTKCRECGKSGCYRCLPPDTATPPTPDRAAVREADTRLALSILEKILGGLGYARTERNAEKQDAQYDELARALGVDFERTKVHPYPADIVRALADALLRPAPLPADVDFDAARVMAEIIEPPLPPRDGQHPSITLAQSAVYNLARAYLALAAVSRPAEARGEPVAWAVRRTDAPAVILHVTLHQPNADGLASMQGVEVVPLYTHPAPSGGEVEKWHRSDCDSKVMGEDACDSWCGAAKCRTRAILAAAPRPETGEVTDEQLCDLYRAHWQTRVDNAELIKAEAMLFAFVRAALAAREGA